MIQFLKSFYIKLSAIFLVLLILMGISQILITRDASELFYRTADQTMNRQLAQNIATDFTDAVADSIDFASIKHMIHYMMVINPGIEIYMLDESGKVIAFFAESYKKLQTETVDLGPVRDFIADSQATPIFGDDPRHLGRKKVFSAAPLQIGKNIDGFLYVIIESEQFDIAAETVWESFAVKTLIRSLLVSILVTGIIGLIMFALLTRQLRRITVVVQDFEKGKLNERIPVKKNDEIGHLSASFNKLADTIVANMDELKKTDIFRRELVANISHDLRNPIAAIKGYLETLQLKNDSLDLKKRQEYLTTTLQISNMLEKLVEQLFELSKLEASQVKPQLEPFSVSDLLQDVIMKFKDLAEKKGIHLRAELPEKLPQAYADIGLIERALSNLIDNALRYTPENGEVNVTIKKGNQQIRVSVSDTGCGIREEELPFIFDRFYRVEKSRARATGGAGLGLAITEKILEIHKSTISVDSRVDEGSTFAFDLRTWQPA
ncbi:MAG: HAMP domain-containing protein [Calditrichaeota bacterium]|nr:MAG: HAMP domain-containing protein [Calditrichota bacterium]